MITPATCDSGDGPGLFLHFISQTLHLSSSSVYNQSATYLHLTRCPPSFHTALKISLQVCQGAPFRLFHFLLSPSQDLSHSLWQEQQLHFSPSHWLHKYGWAFSSYLREILNKSKMLQINARYQVPFGQHPFIRLNLWRKCVCLPLAVTPACFIITDSIRFWYLRVIQLKGKCTN